MKMANLDLEELSRVLVDQITEYVLPVVDKLARQIDTIAAALEEREKQLRYCGVYEAGRKYSKGNFVTDGGSLWHCDRETTTRPGVGDCWTLAVKRGRDA